MSEMLTLCAISPAKRKNILEQSCIYEKLCREKCSNEEIETLDKAFFRKEKDLNEL